MTGTTDTTARPVALDRVEHELHSRRRGRNRGVFLLLVAFIVLVFGLTIAKVQRGGTVEAFDHTFRNSLSERAQ